MHKAKPSAKHVIFFDIDGTLIKPNQKTNSEQLPKTIRRLSKKGVLFGLNSNRSYEDVTELSRKFSLNGPLILENGVYYRHLNKNHYLTKNPLRVQKRIFTFLQEFSKQANLDATPELIDTVAHIKSNDRSSKLHIVMNANRKYTASIHILKKGAHDRLLAKKLCRFLRKKFVENKLALEVECPASFGNVIVYPKGVDKGDGLSSLKKKLKYHHFYMVGDDPADLKTSKQISRFFAVGNAHKKVLQRASFASPHPYTKGVVDILEHFEKTYLDKNASI